jgi:hypothetical protein
VLGIYEDIIKEKEEVHRLKKSGEGFAGLLISTGKKKNPISFQEDRSIHTKSFPKGRSR